jgi:uncharacterized protein (TIGR02646 family)
MRKVEKDKHSKPSSLDETKIAFQSELSKNQIAFDALEAGEDANFNFRLYKNDDVRHKLEELFHGKCAYCESRYNRTQPVDIEHFRPKARVSGVDGFRGYWWLAADWNNLLPSCIDCNRARKQSGISRDDLERIALGKPAQDKKSKPYLQGKADAFPLLDENDRAKGPGQGGGVSAERPYLINPADPDYEFENFFRYDFSKRFEYGVLMLPVGLTKGSRNLKQASLRALHTIEICGLNRLRLLQARHRLLVEVDCLIKAYDACQKEREESDRKTRPNLDRIEKNIIDVLHMKMEPDSEYCHMVRAYLRQEVGLQIPPVQS